jgi:hypothetical protein
MRTAHMIECQLRGIADLLRNAGADADIVWRVATALLDAHFDVVEIIDGGTAAFEASERRGYHREENLDHGSAA